MGTDRGPYLGQITLNRALPNVVERGSIRVQLGMFGPVLAATIMRLFVSRDGLKATLGFVRPWRYYAVAVAGPAVFIATIVFVDHVSGLGRFTPARPLGLAVPTVVFIGGALGLPLTVGEEYGWRGYLLPRLLPLGEIKDTDRRCDLDSLAPTDSADLSALSEWVQTNQPAIEAARASKKSVD